VPSEVSELDLLDLAPAAFVLGPGGGAAPSPPPEATALVLRVIGSPEGTVVVPLASRGDGEEYALAVASVADLCFGMSPSRFANLLPRAPSPEDVDRAMSSLAISHDASWPARDGRPSAVVALLRRRYPVASQRGDWVHEGQRFHVVESRDPRLGTRPGPILHSSSPTALLRARQRSADLSEGPHSFEPQVLGEIPALEARAARSLRAVFVSEGEALRLLHLVPTRRVGVVSLELAHDLLDEGAIGAESLHAVIDAADLAAAAPLDLDLAGAEVVVTGIGAGPGAADGPAVFSLGEVTSHAEAGQPPILFVHEVTREDAAALRRCAGIVAIRGGLTGEAAIMARALGIPCITSGAALALQPDGARSASTTIGHGEMVTIDGKTGVLVRGVVPRLLRTKESVSRVLAALPRHVFVRARVVADVASARALGAEGVLVVRTSADVAAVGLAARAAGLGIATEPGVDPGPLLAAGLELVPSEGLVSCAVDATLATRLSLLGR
jgi:phosphohistidine swiveling domain-containing protein